MLCFRELLVPIKFMDNKGEYQDFLSKNFCLTVSKNLVGEPFRVSLTSISVIATFYASEGYDTVFRRFFCLAEPKNFAGEPFCAVCQKNFGSEKVYG